MITLPISRAARETAAQFAQRQPTPDKAAQVRRNTLAVYAVNDYCRIMEIPTDLTAGDSWQFLNQLGANVADLELIGVGRLECRPVGVEDSVCLIPPEVWVERVGYVGVQLDEANLEATLLGFVPTATAEAVPLTQFRSLDALIDRVHALRQAASRQSVTPLREWLSGQVTAGWQTVEALLDLLNAEPAFAFRSAVEEVGSIESNHPLRRAKLLHLSTREIDYPLALVVELIARADERKSVYAQIHAIEPGTFLPEQLKLAVLDQAGAIVLETQARPVDDYIQLRFRGFPGEQFTLRIELEDTTLTETFVI